MSRTTRPRAALAALSCCVAVGCGTGTAPQGDRPNPPSRAPAAAGHGVVTWASSAGHIGEAADGRGYRLMVHTSVGGSALRVRLTNAFGDEPVTFANVHAGLNGTAPPSSPAATGA